LGLIEETIHRIEPADRKCRHRARERLEQLTMPHWALGRLMDLAEDLAGMTRSMHPPVERRTVVTMAADHGVVEEGVSKYPQEVTLQMVRNFVAGGAGINALSGVADARIRIVDMGVAGDLEPLAESGSIIARPVGPGTNNIARGPAMSREQAVEAVEAGIEIALELAADTDLFGTGEMGIGNTTPSAAVLCAITGASPAEATGRGTGIDDERLEHKIQIVGGALDVNQPDGDDALDVLSKVGGFEIGGIAGLVLAAAAERKPVLVDGLISTAGALIAQSLCAESADYMIAAHRSVEQGHALMLRHLNKHPLLELDLRLGEGTGAAAAIPLVECAVRILTEVATFEEAAVSGAE
jgi:nicotinate-nucleotide--dimethylbenzimidazole phosphoribosyltransferase